jgi:hypothetical protein
MLMAILTSVAKSASQPPELTAFLAMAGQRYSGGLMVVGRAVYGWKAEERSQRLSDPYAVARFADQVRQSVEDPTGRCPMLWVTDCWGNPLEQRNNKLSAFWRVIRSVVERLGIADIQHKTWPSYLVWSNLYKVAPVNPEGNPSGRFRKAQETGCVDLFRLELRTYRPSRLLFLTGKAWAAPFIPSTTTDNIQSSESRYVERCGTLESIEPIRYVVAAHPQGKTECRWTDEVVKAFE